MADNIWSANGGLYLGFPADTTEGSPPNIKKRPLQIISDRQMVVIGPNGSGKSRRILLPQLAALTECSIVVLDIPKGELTRATLDYRRRAGNEINNIDPFDVSGFETALFNPVAALDPDSDGFIDDAAGIAQAVVPITGNDPYWSTSAQDLCCAGILYSRLTDKGGGSLVHVRELLSQSIPHFVKTVRDMRDVADIRECPELAVKAARFSDMKADSKEMLGVVASFLSASQWIDSRPIKRSLTGPRKRSDGTTDNGAIDFARIKQVPTTTYICLPGNRVYSHAPWLKLVITSIVQALLRGTKDSKVPVLLMLDEASLLGGLEILERSMAVLRGYGVKIMSVYQDVPQARLALKERYASYLANAGVLVSFAAQDLDTASELSKRTGQVTAYPLGYSTRPSAEGDAAGGTVSIGQTKIPGMLPQDVMSMDPGFAIGWTHQHKGTLRLYFPDPSALPETKDLARMMG